MKAQASLRTPESPPAFKAMSFQVSGSGTLPGEALKDIEGPSDRVEARFAVIPSWSPSRLVLVKALAARNLPDSLHVRFFAPDAFHRFIVVGRQLRMTHKKRFQRH